MDIVLLIIPVFIIIVIGMMASKLDIFTQQSSTVLINLVFYIVIPAQLFLYLSKAPIHEVLNWSYLASYVLASSILMVFAACISKFKFGRNSAETILNVMGSFHVNAAYLGIPIFILLFNDPNPVIGIIVFQNIMNIMILCGLEITVKRTTQNLAAMIPAVMIKNPIIIGALSGLAMSIFHVQLPQVMVSVLTMISNSATFLALFALGLSLAESPLNKASYNLAELSSLTINKSILHPVLGFIIGKCIFNLNPIWLKSLVLICAMPTAKNLFIFAKKYEIEVEKSNWLIFITTFLSLITLNIIMLML